MVTATEVITELKALSTPEELPKVRKRLRADEAAFGVRMRDLFATAQAHTGLAMEQLDVLLDHPAYEPRMAAFCILDFKARRRIEDSERRLLCQTYLRRHDRITTWDMVDRAAPRVLGGYLRGGPYDPLIDLAKSEDALRRRSAMTAPLYFVRSGNPADLDAGFALAERLLVDPEPVVHNAVGIFLKHAGTRDPERLRSILSAHAASMPRSGLRLAVEKLDPHERSHYLALS